MNKIKKLKKPIIIFIACIFVYGVLRCVPIFRANKPSKENKQQGSDIVSENTEIKKNNEPEKMRFKRNTASIDYSSVEFIPWDAASASENMIKREKKPYSIMVYMNGSDLESEIGAATDDLIEMLESGVSSDNVNIIIFTGGTNRWQNDVIPENNCIIWEIADGEIYELTGVGLLDMGNPGTLAGFIDFSIENFPADKYGLILWDHGGGSIAGYGHDEKFNNSSLSLLDMNYAFENSALKNNKLEFLGFDSCLMASVEMAIVASDYAKYLIASEDLTPGDGWDYSFLSALNYNPSIDGKELGIAISDSFMNYYGPFADEDLNISVIDLSNVDRVMNSMGNLMALCSESLIADRMTSFTTLARKRSRTKTFGSGSPRDNESDMIDIGDMANKLADLFPNEAAEVLSSLEESVIYHRHNSHIDLGGLNTYYVYHGKEMGKEALNTYTALVMDEEYTGYLHRFFNMLSNGKPAPSYKRSRSAPVNEPAAAANHGDDNLLSTDLTLWQPVSGKDGYFIMTGIKNDIDSEESISNSIKELWPKIEDKFVCLYKISDSGEHVLYAVPIELNGQDADIIILFSEKYPEGKILGARNQDGFIIQKGYDEIKDGDKISFYYRLKDFNTKEEEKIHWYKGDNVIIDNGIKLSWSSISDHEIYYSLLMTDIWNNKSFTSINHLENNLAAS